MTTTKQKRYGRIYSKGYAAGKAAALRSGNEEEKAPVENAKDLTGPEVQEIINRSLGNYGYQEGCPKADKRSDCDETAAALQKFLWSFCGSGVGERIKKWYDEDGRL